MANHIQCFDNPDTFSQSLIREFTQTDFYLDHPHPVAVLDRYTAAIRAMIESVDDDITLAADSSNRKLAERKNVHKKSNSVIARLEQTGAAQWGCLAVTAAYFPVPGALDNLTTSSRRAFVAVCECDLAPYPHPFLLVPNTNKGTCGHRVVKSHFLAYTKSILFRHPALLFSVVDEDAQAFADAAEADAVTQFRFVCPECQQAYSTSAFSRIRSFVCGGCQRKMGLARKNTQV